MYTHNIYIYIYIYICPWRDASGEHAQGDKNPGRKAPKTENNTVNQMIYYYYCHYMYMYIYIYIYICIHTYVYIYI